MNFCISRLSPHRALVLRAISCKTQTHRATLASTLTDVPCPHASPTEFPIFCIWTACCMCAVCSPRQEWDSPIISNLPDVSVIWLQCPIQARPSARTMFPIWKSGTCEGQKANVITWSLHRAIPPVLLPARCMHWYFSCLDLCLRSCLLLAVTSPFPVHGQSGPALLLCSIYPGIAYSFKECHVYCRPSMDLRMECIGWVSKGQASHQVSNSENEKCFPFPELWDWAKVSGWQSGVVTVGCLLSLSHSLSTCCVLGGQKWYKDGPALGLPGMCQAEL